MLLCTQYRAGTEEVATNPSIAWDVAGLRVGQMLQGKFTDIESYIQVYVHPVPNHPVGAYLAQLATHPAHTAVHQC